MKQRCNLKDWLVLPGRMAFAFLFFWLLVSWSGCDFGGASPKVVEGTVTVAGEKADLGVICFVPIEGTPGGNNATDIVNGSYRISSRGGLRPGKYRVEFTARKKTGRKTIQDTGIDQRAADELITISPPLFASKNSPLVAEITSDFDGQFDIEIPTK